MDINTFTIGFFEELRSNQRKIVAIGQDSVLLRKQECSVNADGTVTHIANCACDDIYQEWVENEQELRSSDDDY